MAIRQVRYWHRCPRREFTDEEVGKGRSLMTVHACRQDPASWRVEEMSYDGRTFFAGQNAEGRALKHAEWLQSRFEYPGCVDRLDSAAPVCVFIGQHGTR